MKHEQAIFNICTAFTPKKPAFHYPGISGNDLPHSTGRPPKYCDCYAPIAGRLCMYFGTSNVVLAQVFGVNLRTIKRWKKRHQEFSEQIEAGLIIYQEKYRCLEE